MFIFAFNPEYFCPQRLVYEHDEQANKPQNHNKSQIQKSTEGNPAVSYSWDCAPLVFGGVPLLSRAIQYGGQVVWWFANLRRFFPAK